MARSETATASANFSCQLVATATLPGCSGPSSSQMRTNPGAVGAGSTKTPGSIPVSMPEDIGVSILASILPPIPRVIPVSTGVPVEAVHEGHAGRAVRLGRPRLLLDPCLSVLHVAPVVGRTRGRTHP